MSNHDQARYRVFCPAGEIDTLSADLTIEEQYPAFCILLATSEEIETVRERYPVELLAPPRPAPSLTRTAGVEAALTEGPTRGPYTVAVRFRAPLRPGWAETIAGAGCELLEAIGSKTVVVSCATKRSLAKLGRLPGVERVTDYAPPIQVSIDSLQLLPEEEDPATPAEMATRSAGADKGEPRDAKPRSIPGVLIATFFSADAQQRAKRSLLRKGIRDITPAGELALVISLAASADPAEDFRTIASRPELRSLQEKSLSTPFSNLARDIIAGRAVISRPAGLGLTGDGEIVAVADTGLDTGDPDTVHRDFRGRIREIQSFPIAPSWMWFVKNPGADDGAADLFSGHGTHVAGSVLGDGAAAAARGLDPIRGSAPGAQLVFQAMEQMASWNFLGAIRWRIINRESAPPPHGLFGIPDDLGELFGAAYNRGARIHSNSWAGGQPGAYEKQSADIDRFVWEHRDMLIVVAAGNDGTDVNPPGGSIDATSITPPGTAKNCLTVGASENDRGRQFTATYGAWWPSDFGSEPIRIDLMADSVDDIAAFSNRGPCRTGRRKPDVVAPGTFILSTRSSQMPANNFAWGAFPPAKGQYMFMGGTSMATPLVAGCAALVRQYLRQIQNIQNPSAALLKAMLIHSAQYHPYRYARPDSTRWADNEQGWGRVDLGRVLSPDAPETVMFFDVTPGLPANEMREVRVEVTNGSLPLRITLVYTDYPGESLINNLNLFAYDPDGNYHVGNDFDGSGVPDAGNNVEGVFVENPKTGVWRVQVVASDLPHAPQDYALVVSGGGVSLA